MTPMKTSTLTRCALQMDTSRWLISQWLSNQPIIKIIRSLSSIDQKVLMKLGRGENIDRRYILKAYYFHNIQKHRYRAVHIAITTIFFGYCEFICLFSQKKVILRPKTHISRSLGTPHSSPPYLGKIRKKNL